MLNDDNEIQEILRRCRCIAVIGLSSNPSRPSNGVAAFMQEQDYRVIPVNPNETSVLGERAYPNLASLPFEVELVNVFRRSEFAGEAVDDAISFGAKAVWLQEGVVDHGAALRAESAGLMVVMDRCWLKEYYRFFG